MGALRACAAGTHGVSRAALSDDKAPPVCYALSAAALASATRISKWLRLADKPVALEALQEERLDVARAMALAPVRDEQRVAELVKAAARGGSLGTTYAAAQDDARLADAKRKLSLVRIVSPLGHATLLDIRDLVSVLLQQAGANSSAATCANEQQLAGRC